MKSLQSFLAQWNETYSDRAKLQHTYATLAIIALLAAGLIGLINYSLGQSLLFLAAILALVFIGNGVVWALIHTFAIPRPTERKRQAKK